jgi:DNA-binding transcriptional LysR family regulator
MRDTVLISLSSGQHSPLCSNHDSRQSAPPACLRAVAAAGGIRRSSESLFRASSAVARSVAALEESAGRALFERKGRGMLLTAAGELVRLRADRIEAELREVRDDASACAKAAPRSAASKRC